MAPGPGPDAAPPAGPGDRASSLRARMRGRADPDGFVAFDRFMETALYAEGVGYYDRGPSPFGPRGDFYTAPHVHPLFARTVAARIRAACDGLVGPGPVRVVELGPGDGTLAEGVIRALGRAGPRAPVEYVLVERSASLGRTALERAGAAGEEVGLPVRRAASIAADGPGRGVVLANELMDALPARRLRWTGNGWAELGVRVEGDRIVPAEAPVREPVPAPPLPDRPEVGTVVEISAAAEALVREVADHLVEGLFIILDYGMGQSELIAAHPRGTLGAVRGHRTVDDPLSSPGETDLSVFVNFDRLRAAARAAGWAELAYRSQAEALGAWGFPELLAAALREARSAEEEVRLRLAAKNLLFGFDRFRALELGIPRDGGAGTVSPGPGAGARP